MILVLISTNSHTICWVFPYWQSIYYICVQCWPLKFQTIFFLLWPYLPKTHHNMKIPGKAHEAWSKSSMTALLTQLRVKLIDQIYCFNFISSWVYTEISVSNHLSFVEALLILFIWNGIHFDCDTSYDLWHLPNSHSLWEDLQF